MMQPFRTSILVLAALGNLLFFSQAQAISKGNLSVEIEGLKNQKGQVCLSIFSRAQGFPTNPKGALQSQCVKIAQGRVTANFPNLKAGNYAVAIIHDANSDGVLNTNVFGIPTEGFGFSRNPIVRTAPPKFGDSSVLVVGAATDIQIQLQYLL